MSSELSVKKVISDHMFGVSNDEVCTFIFVCKYFLSPLLIEILPLDSAPWREIISVGLQSNIKFYETNN